jgi:hypothetical protein
MAGRGRAPKLPTSRRNGHAPARGEWRAAPGVGWQYGPIPDPPDGLATGALEAWTAWMRSWVAAYWTPGDLPVLQLIIRLFDLVDRGQASASLRTELRLLLDNYGLTPKGAQDRRWAPPRADEKPAERYGHLRAVDGGRGVVG